MQADRRRLAAAAITLVLIAALLTAGAIVMNGTTGDTVAETTPTPESEPTEPDPSPTELIPTPTPEPTEPERPTPTPAETATPTHELDVPTQAFADVEIDLELVAQGLHGPSGIFSAPDGTDRLFVLERPGRIRILEDEQFREHSFLDITEQVVDTELEQGLLGLVFHPNYSNNGQFYVNYTDLNGNTVVSRFHVSEDPSIADHESEMPILHVEQPHYSHNGGHLAFGPDGYLYISLGDGENPGDPHENAQDPSTLLGSILRIDVDSGEPYAIPPDNPFVDDPEVRDEVWAYGLRNPWRFSFDPVTNDLFIADVGQWEVEEINFHPAGAPSGGNYGWPIMEGDTCYEADECDAADFIGPIATYTHEEGGCAVIGGYVYRGQAFPELDGIYLFSDWCTGEIWGLVESNGEWQYQSLLEPDIMVSAFGHDRHGEPYVVDIGGGNVFKMVPR